MNFETVLWLASKYSYYERRNLLFPRLASGPIAFRSGSTHPLGDSTGRKIPFASHTYYEGLFYYIEQLRFRFLIGTKSRAFVQLCNCVFTHLCVCAVVVLCRYFFEARTSSSSVRITSPLVKCLPCSFFQRNRSCSIQSA